MYICGGMADISGAGARQQRAWRRARCAAQRFIRRLPESRQRLLYQRASAPGRRGGAAAHERPAPRIAAAHLRPSRRRGVARPVRRYSHRGWRRRRRPRPKPASSPALSPVSSRAGEKRAGWYQAAARAARRHRRADYAGFSARVATAWHNRVVEAGVGAPTLAWHHSLCGNRHARAARR